MNDKEKIFNSLFVKLLNFIYPSTCISCTKIIKDKNSLCPECWSKLQFIQKPNCNICSMPLKYKVSENDICPSCIKKTPLYTEAKAIFVYGEIISKLIFGFKYYDKPHLSKTFAKFLFNHSKNIIKNIDIIIPVPLHKKRLTFRKYNQSALLTKDYGKLVNKEYILDFLKRKKDTTPQVKLKGKERYKNLKSTFYVNPKYLNKDCLLQKYKDKNFLLIDDVMTTGTTINECTKVLLKNGVKNVYALTIAKTILRD